VSEDDCEAGDESDLAQNNVIEESETTAQRDVCAGPNVHGLIRTTWKSNSQAEKVIVMVSAMETRRNKGNKKKYDTLGQ
jgi:hypothetical protein